MRETRCFLQRMKLQLALGFLVFFIVSNGNVVSSEEEFNDIDLKKSYRFITSSIHALRQCQKHLTFLASIAVGAFATTVLKESPLTPLPLPPMDKPPRWNLVTLPAHFANPLFKWMRQHNMGSYYMNQRIDSAVPLRDLEMPLFIPDIMPSMMANELVPFGRHLGREIKVPSKFVQEAVSRTLKPLKHLSHIIGMRNFLLRWCH